MIDLTQRSLPTTIDCDGEALPIHTDYRLWIRFGDDFGKMKRDKESRDFSYIFKSPPPSQNWVNAAIDFFTSPSATPTGIDESSTIILDYIRDGEYIFGSFMDAYGINLLEADLHWHVFRSLVVCLPQNTKMVEIMGYRGYKKDDRKPELIYAEQRRKWTLPAYAPAGTIEDEEYLRQMEFFGL